MQTSAEPSLPVVVIGAGPVGLAAAAQLRRRGVPVLVLEAGASAGASVAQWRHVRLFSPWAQVVDPAAVELLEAAGWNAPNPARYPTGAGWVADYLLPLADALRDSVRYQSTVTAVAKQARDRLVSSGRGDAPFTVHVQASDGSAAHIVARAVIDASGTWSGPNPLGGDGVSAIGEKQAADRISYRIPDVGDPGTQARYAGKHIVVAGTGASAKGALIALTELAKSHADTTITWLVRRANLSDAFASGGQDELPQRGALGRLAQEAIDQGPVQTRHSFRTARVLQDAAGGQMCIESFDGQLVSGVDEAIVLTGFRPDLELLSEMRLDLDPVLQAPSQLAPLIDPNVHSCGTVYPHGASVLRQPEEGFYLVGMKSYGRATSFLALTGYEQVRSVAAAIAGDHEAAAKVELTLPETGVCGGSGQFDG